MAAQRPETPNPTPRLTDKTGVAEYVGVSPRTVEGWIIQRTVPFIRINARTNRFDLNEIDAWLDAKRVPVGGSDA